MGLKIAATQRFLVTYTLQFRAGKATISKFVVVVCRTIDDLIGEHLNCLGWKEFEPEFRLRWNVPMP